MNDPSFQDADALDELITDLLKQFPLINKLRTWFNIKIEKEAIKKWLKQNRKQIQKVLNNL